MLPHTIGPNRSDKIRRVIWYRVYKKLPKDQIKNLDQHSFIYIWKEWFVLNYLLVQML
jgi:hypothetical protein